SQRDHHHPPSGPSSMVHLQMGYTTRPQPVTHALSARSLRITPKRTRPYRPQTNGKVERLHRTMADGWAYSRCYTSESDRRASLDGWLHQYNQHRPHSACDNQPPFSRLINVPDQYI